DIMSLKWPDIADAGIDAGRGAIGLVMQYKDKSRVVELLHATRVPIIGTRYELVDTNRLDELITGNMETLIGINQNLGYLASHGSPSLTPRMMQSGGNQQKQLGNLNRHLSENYSIKRINLEKQAIPESLNCLLIAQPTKKFSDYELFQIDQALMRGTNLAIFADAYKKAEQARQQRNFRQPSYAPFDSGLAKLLKHYGLRHRKALVLDKNCYQQNLPDRAGGGQQPVYYAPRIKNKNINKKLDFMKRIKGLITVKNSPLELMEKRVREQGIKAEKLFASSADSWLAEGELTLNPMFMKPPQKKEKFSSHGLAFLLEGGFQSRFEAGSLPVKETGKNEEEAAENAGIDLSRIQGGQEFIQSGRPAKIAVIGSSALLEDNLIDRKGRSPNTTFVLNIIDVLNQRSDIASLRSKTQRFNPLAETTAATRSMVKVINVAGLPVLVIVCGLFAWWRRRLRKKRIRMLFES
ncbi:MAG TPA: Gldg family protein, partial [Desulfosalsimonadaceae bacterium]|nr:Gldg family protein [Desulfosalsimonadaceae bacterium]